MKIQKGFSLLEMLIVIIIVSILFMAFRSSFQIKNKDVLYGQACIETIYGQVNNFLHAGLNSKSINSGGTAVFPDQYIIRFMPSLQTIDLTYKIDGSGYIYSSIELTGNSNLSYCSKNNYTILMTGDHYEAYINKGLQENQNMQTFYLSGTSGISTGANIFLQCDLQGTECKTMARFESDIRTISIKKQMCLSFTGAGDCFERDN